LKSKTKTEVTFDVKYEHGHCSVETWIEGSFFCPGCGKKHVWEEQGEGDYYCGPLFICPSCSAEFTMQYDGPQEDWQSKQRVSAILEMKKTA
jgi:hypothetical protein